MTSMVRYRSVVRLGRLLPEAVLASGDTAISTNGPAWVHGAALPAFPANFSPFSNICGHDEPVELKTVPVSAGKMNQFTSSIIDRSSIPHAQINMKNWIEPHKGLFKRVLVKSGKLHRRCG